MSKMIVLTGPPASGKSTLARVLVEEESPAIIVNRDDIRDMCGKYWVPEREDLITKLENGAVIAGLESGYNVIIDATNLNPKVVKKWYKIVEDLQATIEFIDLRVSKEVAIARDEKRRSEGKRFVGEVVINRFYNRYGL